MDAVLLDTIREGPTSDASRTMEQLRSTSIYEFNPNQLREVRKLYGFTYGDDVNEAIDQFVDWIKKQNHFVVTEFEREYLEHFIIFNKGSIERAKQRLDKICTMRNLMPEIMGNIDVKNEFIPLLAMSHHCILPKPTKDNNRVLYSSVNIKDHIGFDLLQYYRYMITILQYAHCHEYSASMEVVLDVRQFSFSMLTKMNPIVAHKGVTLMTDAFGFRMKAFHLVSSSKFVDALVKYFKQVFSEKLASRIHVHSTYDTLFNYIEKAILPVEIGGEFDKTFKEISDDVFKELCSDSHLDHLKFMEKAITDESRRVTSSFNEEYSGMPGSFRTFCVD